MNEWISVEKRLPEPSIDVLAFCISHGESTEWGHINTYEKGEAYLAIDKWCEWRDSPPSFRSDRFYGKVTHWMPLPKPPEV